MKLTPVIWGSKILDVSYVWVYQYLVRIYSVIKLVAKDIATDSAGNVYVLDGGSNRVQKITTDGTFVKEWNIN